MSNQEAIALLRNLEDSLDSYCELSEEGKTAFRMAIEALSSSEIPNSSDTISRKAVTDAIEKCHKQCCREDATGDVWIHYETTLNEVESISPAQPKRGKWEMGKDERFVECSECGLMTTRNELRGLAVFGKNEPNFCPNCGAAMEKEATE